MSEFITDEMVSEAVVYLAIDPHPIAVTKANVTRKENARKAEYSRLFLKVEGKTNPEKEARTQIHEDYVTAQDAEADAIQEYEEERARQRNAEMITELWRSVQANRRASEKVF